MKLRLLAEADAEVEEARCYLNLMAENLGERFLDDLDLILLEISERPDSFPLLETLSDNESYRRALLSSTFALFGGQISKNTVFS